MNTYSEKLRDPRWQRKRLEILQRDNFKCLECDSTEKTLHVHHKTYVYAKNPWEYENDNFLTLCFECHEMEEEYGVYIKDIVKNLLLRGHSNASIYCFIENAMNENTIPYPHFLNKTASHK